ncbi:hypothetical protein BJV74DRAFT_295957 [Russula compacta]|nr:hypothetical protein BJV74DRAFT_295957 [Russula compacta]
MTHAPNPKLGVLPVTALPCLTTAVPPPPTRTSWPHRIGFCPAREDAPPAARTCSTTLAQRASDILARYASPDSTHPTFEAQSACVRAPNHARADRPSSSPARADSLHILTLAVQFAPPVA